MDSIQCIPIVQTYLSVLKSLRFFWSIFNCSSKKEYFTFNFKLSFFKIVFLAFAYDRWFKTSKYVAWLYQTFMFGHFLLITPILIAATISSLVIPYFYDLYFSAFYLLQLCHNLRYLFCKASINRICLLICNFSLNQIFLQGIFLLAACHLHFQCYYIIITNS